MPRRRTRPKRSPDRARTTAPKHDTIATPPPTAEHFSVNPVIKSMLLIGVIFLIVIPSLPHPLGTGLDASWAFGLNMGHFDRMIFGRDIVFTYGPLGYLIFPTFPEAEPWAVFAFAWGSASVIAYALWKLCRYAAHWTTMCLYLGVFWVCSAFLFDFPSEHIMAAIIAVSLVVAARFEDKPWFDLGILFFLAGVALLTKFNLGIIALLVALCFEASLLWRHRSAGPVLKPAAVALMIWLSTFAGLYWMLEGTPWGLAAFLRNSVEIVRGYSDAMGWPGPLWAAIAAVLCCMVLICIPLAASEIRRIAWGIPPLGVISFMCFKSAMVRQDYIHTPLFPFQIAMAALLLVALAPTPRNRIVVGVFAFASLALGITMVTQLAPAYLPSDLDRLTGRAALRNLNGFLHWKATLETWEANAKQALTSDQLPWEFRPYVAGKRVDAYPWEIAMIRANHLRWQPLPVIQAYSAYTPDLDLLNARKLEDASGPEEILLSWGAIDGHHPFYETPHSWRALLNWYDLQVASPNLYLLRRRSTARFDPPVAAGNVVVARWDQRITLPTVGNDEALVMEADIEESLKGVLKRTLFRSPAVYVRPVFRSGLFGTARVVRVNLREGVIVNFVPIGLSDLRPIFSGGGKLVGDRVASISFETDAPAEYDPLIQVHWWRQRLHDPAM